MSNRLTWSFVSLVGFIALAFGSAEDPNAPKSGARSSPAPSGGPAPSGAAAPASEPVAASQAAFCSAVTSAAADYRAAEGDLKKSRVRTVRKGAVVAAVPRGKVTDWTGTITELTTTSEGKAVLGVELPCGVSVGTWNNMLSDIGSDTLIQQSSPLFDGLADLKVGQRIGFSGTLITDDKNGFNEKSLTEFGSMTDSEWAFRFTTIKGPL